MARDYRKVLEAAEALAIFTGYLDSEDLKRRNQAQRQFNEAVRIFVYGLFHESPDAGALPYSVSADLDRIAAGGHYSETVIADARAALLAEIRARSRNHPAMRFLIRWGPPVLGLLGLAAYFYFKARVL